MKRLGVAGVAGVLALLLSSATTHPALGAPPEKEKAGGFGQGMGSGQTGWGFFDVPRSTPSAPGSRLPPTSPSSSPGGPGAGRPALPYAGSFVNPEELAASRGVAVVEVRLPADARLWFDDVLTRKRGPDRVFRTPPLKEGRSYYYIVRARWRENGTPVEKTRKVSIRAGRRSFLDFTQPPGSRTAGSTARP